MEDRAIVRKGDATIGTSVSAYDRLITQFESPGAIHLRDTGVVYHTQLEGRLSAEQEMNLATHVMGYVLDTLSRGQVKDLEGLDAVVSLLKKSKAAISPAILEKIVSYHGRYDKLTIQGIRHRMTGTNPSGTSRMETDTAKEICDLADILLLMKGYLAGLDEITPSLGYGVTILMESLVGMELPELRKAVPYAARELIVKDVEHNKRLKIT